jgi:predicted O-linked N-acetylglucosamine transferase (SPINDLY family)
VHFFAEPILTAHDHQQFEVFCYSAALVGDEVTARLKAVADHWRDVGYKTDAQIAEMVREDRIDILVDLAGHIGENRLLVFARKPAPVQVTYIGYQNTTGMSAMDYRLTDERSDPSGLTDSFYSEQLVRLPRSFFCYRPPDVAPAITPLPAQETGHVTFGAFNSLAKTTPQAITAWLQVLARVPGSRLLILAPRGGHLERIVRASAGQQDIDPKRIELCDRRPLHEYLQLLQQADIGLDPFPFNGHTTTCDSIWMGVPVVMLEGNTYASRFGGSVLANVGLEHLITRSVRQYVDAAENLAGDLIALAKLRGELRGRMSNSPLLDFPGFTRNVEQAYRQMWRAWCAA